MHDKMVKINEVGMLGSDFRMVKSTFVMFKITPKHTFNHSKSIKCIIYTLLNAIFMILKLIWNV